MMVWLVVAMIGCVSSKDVEFVDEWVDKMGRFRVGGKAAVFLSKGCVVEMDEVAKRSCKREKDNVKCFFNETRANLLSVTAEEMKCHVIIADVDRKCVSGVTFVDESGTQSVRPGHCYIVTSPDMNVELRNVAKDDAVFHARNWVEVKSTVNCSDGVASLVVGFPPHTRTPVTHTPIHVDTGPSDTLAGFLAMLVCGLIGLAVRVCCYLARQTEAENSRAQQRRRRETPLATVEPGRIIIYTNSQTQDTTRIDKKPKDIQQPLITAVPTPEPPADPYQNIPDEPNPYQNIPDGPNPYQHIPDDPNPYQNIPDGLNPYQNVVSDVNPYHIIPDGPNPYQIVADDPDPNANTEA